MPLDAVCLSALIKELAPALEGARIDKVQQPERDILLLSLYTRDGNRRLLLSAKSGAARLHFTAARMENPESPPMFCMLLRKHIVGARITGVTQPTFERLAAISLDVRDELGVASQKRLIIEMIGRSANIILLDSEARIIDCLRRVDFGEDAFRRLLPGMIYRMPPKQAKPGFFELDAAGRRALYEAMPAEISPEKWMMETFSGLSPLIVREIWHRAGAVERFPEAMDAFAESVAAGEFTPILLRDAGRAVDFSFMLINQYGTNVCCEPHPDFSALLDAFYSGRDKAERMRRISSETVKTVKTLRDRQARKLAQQRRELADTADREVLRRRGDLVTANLWRMKKGDRKLEAEDFYTEGSPAVSIPLDPMKTPQQNAAALYKEYKKAAAAEKHLSALIREGEIRLYYLESVLDVLARSESESDVAEVRRELLETGVLSPKKNANSRKVKRRGPMRFVSSSGYEILVGRSNIQNDELTLKTARRSDIWLHTQRVHGSHVIIRTCDRAPDGETLAQAASLAAYFSQAREAGKTPVDYTEARFVKKPAGAMPGMVTYTGQRTLMAEPDELLVQKLEAE
ncbi:MAG TPA: fibronectin/fibrinogen-binding protein [Clostridiales bacterium]|nr:fibronectin/fibrinogen-binding protein [Clostridiales bacterium]